MLQTSLTAWLTGSKGGKQNAKADPGAVSAVQPLRPASPASLLKPSQPQPSPGPVTVGVVQGVIAPIIPNKDASQLRRASQRSLPPNITLEPANADTLPSYRRLNTVLFPIKYPGQFYDEILTDAVASSITLLALWHSSSPSPSVPNPSTIINTGTGDLLPPVAQPTSIPNPRPQVIAGIRCKLHPQATLYISTIGVLAPYRHHGVASALLHAITVRAVELYGITSVTAHVWDANEEGLQWYLRQGFVVERREEGYYRKLEPQGAVLVRRGVRVGDVVGEGRGR